MTSLRELARLINDMNGTKLDYKGAKRRLDMLGASVEDLKSPAKVQHILKMCSEPPCIWTMYDHLMVRTIKSEKEVAELKETVTVLKVESADHLQAITRLTSDKECLQERVRVQDETLNRMQVDATKSAERIQQLEEECERLRARIDQLEQSKEDYIHKDDPSYVEED